MPPNELDPQVAAVLQSYSLPPVQRIESMGGAGGFSGARFWKVVTEGGEICVRRWPGSHPDTDQLRWMHRVLSHVAIQDCPFVPVPLLSSRHEPFTSASGFHFEVAPWMPGVANFSDSPSEQRLLNAIESLARFHLGSAQVSLDFRPSKNIQRRLEHLNNAPNLVAKIREVPIEVERATERQLREVVVRHGAGLAARLQAELQPFANMVLPTQPIIGDVWHDHILFSGEEVSGIVDFGAMRMDHITMDISRLLGSLLGDKFEEWDFALNHYSTFRPLGESERALIRLLDQTTTLLGSLNWLNWLHIERRQFESMAHVEKRIQHLFKRLEMLVV